MSWNELPLDLFACIAAICKANEVLKLESVCKSWNENLKNELIWKEVCRAGGLHHNTYNDWRQVALRDYVVADNMKHSRFLARCFATTEPGTRLYSSIRSQCSVVGNEALITWTEFENYSSYWFNHFIGHEIVNLDTNQRQKLETTHERAMLTTDYIVLSEGETVSSSENSCLPKLCIIDRRTGKQTKLHITEITVTHAMTGNDNRSRWRRNNDTSLSSIVLQHKKTFYVVNLKEASYTSVQMKNAPDVLSAFTFQYSGSHIAFTNQMPDKKTQLVLLHTETGQTLLNYPMVDFETFHLGNKHILLVAVSAKFVDWKVIDLKGNTQIRVSWPLTTELQYRVKRALLHRNFVVIELGNNVHFFNRYTGAHLTSVTLVGSGGRIGNHFNISAYDAGKFVVTSELTSRVLDFESAALNSVVDIGVIPAQGPEVIQKAKFRWLFDLSILQEIADKDGLAAVILRSDDKERYSLIYNAPSFGFGGVASLPANVTATNLLRDIKVFTSAVNLLPTVGHSTPPFRNEEYYKWDKKVNGPALIFKEELVNGIWMPTDYQKF